MMAFRYRFQPLLTDAVTRERGARAAFALAAGVVDLASRELRVLARTPGLPALRFSICAAALAAARHRLSDSRWALEAARRRRLQFERHRARLAERHRREVEAREESELDELAMTLRSCGREDTMTSRPRRREGAVAFGCETASL